MPECRILVGDCREVLATLPEASVDAVVTDPPYDLTQRAKTTRRSAFPGRYGDAAGGGFMGLRWDGTGVAFDPATWEAVWHVMKPGAHLLAFGGTRTHHRLWTAVEDAGFDIRDTLCWLYSSGFPKSLDVGKALDKAVGAKREVIRGGGRSNVGTGRKSATKSIFSQIVVDPLNERTVKNDLSLPSSDLARQWHGWGTSLKPAWEPILLARKPPAGSIASNVSEYGTGALNIEASRIPINDNAKMARHNKPGANGWKNSSGGPSNAALYGEPSGRWPANVLLDCACESAEHDPDCPVRLLDEQGDGASRFFYVSKASTAERDAGLNGERSPHPTVKPITLMRYLIRLITPPGGIVCDPFMGSGSTGCACGIDEFDFLGIEVSPEYAAVAEQRIRHWTGPLFT